MVRIAHYLNQFFAGIGGEDKADAPFEVREGAVGPGRAILLETGDDAEIVQTLVCGDNAFHAGTDAILDAIVATLAESKPDLLIAGPAFNAGRYGLACGAVCSAVSERLGIPSLTGVYPEAPAVDVYRSRVVMVPTGDSAAGMREAVASLVRVGLGLAAGKPLGPADEDGRIPMGYRKAVVTDVPAARRALDLLMAKLAGEPFLSEVALPKGAEPIPPAPAVADLSSAVIALVTDGGLVPEGNPDRIESSSATRWARYPVADLAGNHDPAFLSIHAGYDSQWVDADPNRLVPLDALQALAAEGVIGKVHEFFYATTGTGTTVTHAERMGEEIAKALISDGVHAVLVTST
ncbi:MAG: glycine/betaine/sarcosine/D-proline family reductase selenoprotein B [Actinobacteria bacterium]|nr:glycine/betaine/sarcosine/D-proline family reductase selenoprotein B [Actinomycetota bacterium]